VQRLYFARIGGKKLNHPAAARVIAELAFDSSRPAKHESLFHDGG
jgi:hypothetical protein